MTPLNYDLYLYQFVCMADSLNYDLYLYQFVCMADSLNYDLYLYQFVCMDDFFKLWSLSLSVCLHRWLL